VRHGVRAGDIPHVARKRLLHVVRPGNGFMARHQARRESAGHHIERAKDREQVMTIQMANDRPMPFEPQGRPERRNHREACLILTEQDQVSLLGFF